MEDIFKTNPKNKDSLNEKEISENSVLHDFNNESESDKFDINTKYKKYEDIDQTL